MLFWITCLICVVLIAFFSTKVFDEFDKTKSWKMSKEVKIATEEPYMLYLSTFDRYNIKVYNKLVEKIYNKTEGAFYKKVNDDDITTLTSEYNKLPETIKEKESQLYNTILSLWPINKEYKSFFDKQGNIPATINPRDIIEFNKKYSESIKKVLDDESDTSKKVLANESYLMIHNIASDISKIAEIKDAFDRIFNITTSKISVKKDVPSTELSYLKHLKDSLNYKWKIIDNYLGPVLKKSEKILDGHDRQIEAYTNYTIALSHKENFEKFVNSYKDMKSKFIKIPKLTTREDLQKNSELLYEVEEEYSDTIEEGKVIMQAPEYNSYEFIYPKSTIKVKISKGKKPVETKKQKSDKEDTGKSNNNIKDKIENGD